MAQGAVDDAIHWLERLLTYIPGQRKPLASSRCIVAIHTLPYVADGCSLHLG